MPLEELEEIDPEAARAHAAELEKQRALDRVSLRHKNTSKWAKSMMRHHAHDIDAQYECETVYFVIQADC